MLIRLLALVQHLLTWHVILPLQALAIDLSDLVAPSAALQQHHGAFLDSLPPFADATRCWSSEAGFGGVLFLAWPDGRGIVVKFLADADEAVSSLVGRELCAVALVDAPDMEVLSLRTAKGRELRKRVRELTGAADRRSRLWLMRGTLERRRTVVLVQAMVNGRAFLPKDERAKSANERLEGAAAALGRIMAVDLLCNNWDRLPSGLDAWQPDPDAAFAPLHPGNLDNLLERASDGAVVAIDTDMKRDANNPWSSEDAFVAQCARAFADVRSSVAASEPSATAIALRVGLGRLRDGLALGDGALLAYQLAMHETLERLASAELLPRMHGAVLQELAIQGGVASGLVRRAQRVASAWRESAN